MKYIAVLDSENEFTEEVIETLKNTGFLGDNPRYAFVIDNIQERKVGKWTRLSNTIPCVNCQLCGKTFSFLQGGNTLNYCPNCGCCMTKED